MRIVGVIDLKGGLAVHAQGGKREGYQPVRRAGHVQVDGDAVRLAHFYRDVCGLDDLYVADLDAIAGATPQRRVLVELAAVGGSMWLDAGVASLEAARAALGVGSARVIVGLETLPDSDVLGHICSDIGATCVVLSLDLRAGRLVCPLGSPMASDSIEDVAANAWGVGISTMIVLDLSRVGGSDGPAIREIGRVRRAAPQATVYAGGGIRSVGDLKDLQAAGVTGALIATSLHDGRLTPANLHPILTR